MDIRSLSIFEHLAHSLHFAKTAKAMHLSAPTLSRIIGRLEEETGALLFVRNNRSVSLTAAGLSFLEFAQTTLLRWQELQTLLHQQQTTLSGYLRFFCSVTASQSHLPRLLNVLSSQYPQIELKLDTGDPALATNVLIDGQADMAIAIHTPNFPPQISFHQLDEIPLVLITPKSLNVSQINQIVWHENKVIMPALGPSKRIVNHWFTEQGIRPKVYASVSGNEAIVSMVSLGLGVGFVPQIVLDNSVVKSKVNRISVADIEAYRLGLCYLKSRIDDPIINAVADLFISA